MIDVSAFEAKFRFLSLLEQVEHGAEFVITKRGKPIARLVPLAPRYDKEAARAAARRMDERAKTTSLGGLRIKDLKEVGRP